MSNRLNAFQSRNEEPNRDLEKITNALERLNTKEESNTFKNDLEKRIEKMQAQLSAQKSVSFSQKIPQVNILLKGLGIFIMVIFIIVGEPTKQAFVKLEIIRSISHVTVVRPMVIKPRFAHK